ncbi:MAG TPA: alpha/beta fold hydrolase [Ignavibacteriaceae bacterium]
MKTRLVSIQIIYLFFLTTFYYGQSNNVSEFEGLKEINSTQLFFKVIGNGEPLLIVHGGPGLGHDYLFEPFKQLADNNTLIFFDQRGCGRSEQLNTSDSVDMNTLVDDIEQIRKEFNISKLNLAGQSWGALISIEYTVKYPENVSKLLLLEPAPGSNEYLGEFQQTIMNRLSQNDKESIAELSQNPKLKFDPILFDEFMSLRFKGYSLDTTFVSKMHMDYFDSLRVLKFFSSAAKFGPYLMNFNLYEKMKSINCPTLIIHGENDPIPNDAIKKMGSNIKNAELHIIKDSGHFVHIEKPKVYFELIRSFLKKSE